jgi:hypothetical protein
MVVMGGEEMMGVGEGELIAEEGEQGSELQGRRRERVRGAGAMCNKMFTESNWEESSFTFSKKFMTLL